MCFSLGSVFVIGFTTLAFTNLNPFKFLTKRSRVPLTLKSDFLSHKIGIQNITNLTQKLRKCSIFDVKKNNRNFVKLKSIFLLPKERSDIELRDLQVLVSFC